MTCLPNCPAGAGLYKRHIKSTVAWKAVQHPASVATSIILLCHFTWHLLLKNARLHKQKYFHRTAVNAALFHWTWPNSSHGEITQKQQKRCLCWPCQRGENKSLWLYFSSRELLHSAVSMSLCMTQWSLIPKGHKVWQFYFLFLPCFLLAVTMKILDFSLIHQKKINLSAEKQAENCLLTVTVYWTFPIIWKTENASFYCNSTCTNPQIVSKVLHFTI